MSILYTFQPHAQFLETRRSKLAGQKLPADQLAAASASVQAYVTQWQRARLSMPETTKALDAELLQRFKYDGWLLGKKLRDTVLDAGVQANGKPTARATQEIGKAFDAYFKQGGVDELTRKIAGSTSSQFIDTYNKLDGFDLQNTDHYNALVKYTLEAKERAKALAPLIDEFQLALMPVIGNITRRDEDKALPFSETALDAQRQGAGLIRAFFAELDGIAYGLDVPKDTEFQLFYLGYWQGLLARNTSTEELKEPDARRRRRAGVAKTELKFRNEPPPAQAKAPEPAKGPEGPEAAKPPEPKAPEGPEALLKASHGRARPAPRRLLLFLGGPDSWEKQEMADRMAERYGYELVEYQPIWFELHASNPGWSKPRLALEADEELVRRVQDRLRRGVATIAVAYDPMTYYSIDPRDELLSRTQKRAMVVDSAEPPSTKWDRRVWDAYFDQQDGELAKPSSAFELVRPLHGNQ